MNDIEKAREVHHGGKKAPLITFFSALIAFILSLVALLSPGNGSLQNQDLVTLNTSTLLQNVIKVETSSTVAARAATVTNFGSAIAKRQFPTLVAPTLPGISAVSSFFESVSSDIASATAESPAPTGTSTNGNGLISDLESLFNIIAGTVTGDVGQEVETVINAVIADAISAAGIKQWYSLYMTEYCEGDYTPSYTSANAKENTTSCTKLNSIKIPKTNSTVQIGTTTLDFSALNIGDKLAKTGGQLNRIFTVIFAFNIIGIVCSGLLLVIAPLSLLPPLNIWSIHFIVAGLATLASVSLGFVTVVWTGVTVVTAGAVNQLVGDLGAEAKTGGSELAILWVSYILMSISSTVWAVRWHKATYVKKEKII